MRGVLDDMGRKLRMSWLEASLMGLVGELLASWWREKELQGEGEGVG